MPVRAIVVWAVSAACAWAADADTVRRQCGVLDDAHVQRWVKQVGDRLATALPPSGQPWSFTVVAVCAMDLEPIALEDGSIFVSSGLLATSATEAEFAGSLAHAMAHVVKGHIRAAAIPAREFPTRVVSSQLLRPSERQEQEADEVAGKALAEIGYHPALSFLERRNVSAERLARYRRLIASSPRRDYVEDSTDFRRVRDRLPASAAADPNKPSLRNPKPRREPVPERDKTLRTR